MSEKFVRFGVRPASAAAIPILTGKPPTEIECSWVAVSHAPEGPSAPETFILYFLDASGVPQAHLQYDTLQAALDQGSAYASIPPAVWRPCGVSPACDWQSLDFGQFPR